MSLYKRRQGKSLRTPTSSTNRSFSPPTPVRPRFDDARIVATIMKPELNTAASDKFYSPMLLNYARSCHASWPFIRRPTIIAFQHGAVPCEAFDQILATPSRGAEARLDASAPAEIFSAYHSSNEVFAVLTSHALRKLARDERVIDVRQPFENEDVPQPRRLKGSKGFGYTHDY